MTPQQLETKLNALAALCGEDIQKMLLPELFQHLDFIAELVDIPGNSDHHDLFYNPLQNFLANLIEQYPYARQKILNVAQKPSGKSSFNNLDAAMEESSLRCEQVYIFKIEGHYILHPYRDAYPNYTPVWENYTR